MRRVQVGIVVPVYMWGLPLVAVEFLKKLKVDDQTYIYMIANCGGLPGKALKQCEGILAERKLQLAAGYSITMPGNYIMGYGAFNEEKQQKLFQKEKQKVLKIAAYTKDKAIRKCEKSKIMIDCILSDLFYKQITEFPESDKHYTVSDQCIGCGLCAKRCSVNNIKMIKGKPEWQHHCEVCVACIQSCPKRAIDYKGKTSGRKRYINPNVKL
ncbi:MAG: EFR1 family ferrodoxin [Cellulosilyticaceae bacterium]